MKAAPPVRAGGRFLFRRNRVFLGGMPIVGRESSDRLGNKHSGQRHRWEKRKNQLRHDALPEGNGSQKPLVGADQLHPIRKGWCGTGHIRHAHITAAGSSRRLICSGLTTLLEDEFTEQPNAADHEHDDIDYCRGVSAISALVFRLLRIQGEVAPGHAAA
jgi:hypothetical protein